MTQDSCELSDIVPGRSVVRFVVIGDFGERDGEGILAPKPRRILAAMAKRHHGKAFDFGLTVGDNFYPMGTKSLPEFSRRWRPYESLGIPFFATLGNHDYILGRARTQVRYSASMENLSQSPHSWNLPCRYYSFTAGPVRFAAIDTDEGTMNMFKKWLSFQLYRPAWSALQASWLERTIAGSRQPWTIAFGHHPVFSKGQHGDTRRLIRLQAMQFDGVDYLVAGGGDRLGFLIVEATASTLTWEFVGDQGETIVTGGRKK